MTYRKKRIPTTTFERQLLKCLMANKTTLQGRLSSCKEEWFTSDERFLLFSFIRESYSTNRNCMTETQFNYLLDSRLGEDDEELRKSILAEYEVIKGVKVDDDLDTITGRLNEALAGVKLEDLLRDAVESLNKGDINDTYERLKQRLVEINPSTQSDDEVTPLWGSDSQWKRNVIDVKEHPEKYAGVKTGFARYDEMTGGLFPAELYMVFGLSGKGKSTLMKQIAINVSNQGKNVLHCANEENKQQIMSKYISNQTQTEYRGWKRGTYSEDDMIRYESVNQQKMGEGQGNIYIYTFKQQTDASSISRKLAELKSQGITIDLVIVDYLDLMSSIVRAYNENDEGGRIAGDLKQIAIDFNVPVMTCTQANTSAEKQETKDRPFLSMDDMFGTKRKIHSSNVVIGIVNKTATVGAGERDEEVTRHRLVICVPKNRDGGVFTFRLVFEVKTGYVHDDDGEFDPVSDEQEAYARTLMEKAGDIASKRAKDATPQERIDIETDAVKTILDDIYTEKGEHAAIQQVKDDYSASIAKDELAVKREEERRAHSYKPQAGAFFSEEQITSLNGDDSSSEDSKSSAEDRNEYTAAAERIRAFRKRSLKK